MKRFSILLLAMSAIFLFSCSKDSSSDDFVQMDVLTISKTITADALTKSGDIRPVQLNFSASYSIAEDKIIDLEFTPISSDIDTDEINAAIHTALVDKLGPDFCDFESVEQYVKTEGDDDESISECLHGCKKNYEKKNGRGMCRFECWYDFSTKVIEWALKVLPTILKLFE